MHNVNMCMSFYVYIYIIYLYTWSWLSESGINGLNHPFLNFMFEPYTYMSVYNHRSMCHNVPYTVSYIQTPSM